MGLRAAETFAYLRAAEVNTGTGKSWLFIHTRWAEFVPIIYSVGYLIPLQNVCSAPNIRVCFEPKTQTLAARKKWSYISSFQCIRTRHPLVLTGMTLTIKLLSYRTWPYLSGRDLFTSRQKLRAPRWWDSRPHKYANIMSPMAIKGRKVVLRRDLSSMIRLSLQSLRCFPLSFFGAFPSLHALVLAFVPSRFHWLNILVTCQILSVPYCDPLTKICYTSYTTSLGISYRIAISDDNASSDAILQVRWTLPLFLRNSTDQCTREAFGRKFPLSRWRGTFKSFYFVLGFESHQSSKAILVYQQIVALIEIGWAGFAWGGTMPVRFSYLPLPFVLAIFGDSVKSHLCPQNASICRTRLHTKFPPVEPSVGRLVERHDWCDCLFTASIVRCNCSWGVIISDLVSGLNLPLSYNQGDYAYLRGTGTNSTHCKTLLQCALSCAMDACFMNSLLWADLYF